MNLCVAFSDSKQLLQYHTRRNSFNFDTAQGEQITKGLNDLSKKFDLSFQFGTAPHDFTISQSVYYVYSQ